MRSLISTSLLNMVCMCYLCCTTFQNQKALDTHFGVMHGGLAHVAVAPEAWRAPGGGGLVIPRGGTVGVPGCVDAGNSSDWEVAGDDTTGDDTSGDETGESGCATSCGSDCGSSDEDESSLRDRGLSDDEEWGRAVGGGGGGGFGERAGWGANKGAHFRRTYVEVRGPAVAVP